MARVKTAKKGKITFAERIVREYMVIGFSVFSNRVKALLPFDAANIGSVY